MSASQPHRDAFGIEVRGLSAAYGPVRVLHDIDLSVADGEIVALLGPSGCGKTTLLRCIAGLERPTSGTIVLGGRDVTSDRGVPAERRHIGMVFQDGALFPHRNVLDNVRYGIRRGPDRDGRAREVLRLVGLEDKVDRMPGMLSGGEQQRVALARALAPRPGVVLLDEPFSSLDAALRVQLRVEVHRLLKEVGVTAILVTHDQEEAMSFGDRVAVMRSGSIEQLDTPVQIYASPRTPWIARFVGEAVMLPARLNGAIAETPIGAIATHAVERTDGTVLLRPEQLTTSPGGASTVVAAQYLGAETRYEVRVAGVDELVVVRSAGPPHHEVGDDVTVSARDAVAHVWPSGT